MTTVSIAEKKIQEIVERSVSRAIRRLLIDPDRGLKLTVYAKRRLRQSLAAKKRGKTISLDALLAARE